MCYLLKLFVTSIAFQTASLSRIDDERIYPEISRGREMGAKSCDDYTRQVFSGLGSISILCLLAIILLYSVFPQLRNLSGKIVLSCAVSTLFATLFLLIVYNHNFQLEEMSNMPGMNQTKSNETDNTVHNLTQSNDTNTTQLQDELSENILSPQKDCNVSSIGRLKHNDSGTEGSENLHIDKNCYKNTKLNFSCVQNKLESTSTCAIVGHLGLFANLSMFSWMTVMCFNLLRMFRRMEPNILNSNFRRFLAYSMFGWGFPFLCILFTLAASIVIHKDSPYNPLIGETICFIDAKDPRRQLIFFHLPMCLLLLLNLIGFIFCVINLRANSREMSARRQRLQSAFSRLAMSRKTRTQLVTYIKS